MGYHVQYLIIRLLLNWQNIADENYYNGKNLQLYYYRNLKEIRELRVKYFFKNLASIAVNEFNKEDILERKSNLPKKLQT
jgi:ADP-dependent phosphofructokinase/glucokinase